MLTLFNATIQTEIEQFQKRLSREAATQTGLTVSIKTSWWTPSHEQEEILLLGSARTHSGAIPAPADWTALRLAPLRDLLRLPAAGPEDLANALQYSRIYGNTQPPPDALLHAAIARPYVCTTEPASLFAVFSAFPASEITGWYAQQAVVQGFEPNLFRLGKSLAGCPEHGTGFILMNRGLLCTGRSAAECLEHYAMLVGIAERQIGNGRPVASTRAGHDRTEILPHLRRELSTLADHPLILAVDDSPEILDIVDQPELVQVLSGTPVSVSLASMIGVTHVDGSQSARVPRVILKPGLGAIAVAQATPEAIRIQTIFHLWAAALQRVIQARPALTLSETGLEEALGWELFSTPERSPYSGEVALVTGAASGIGKACVASFLARGSAVVGLDINPEVQLTAAHPAYLGLVCDITDETAVQDSLRQTVRKFGGLDMLVLNAGLFPSGANIEKLSTGEFCQVLNVNLNANLVLMREAFPLLRLAPRYGRVVAVGSKNTKAPGFGAAAYSASKAAVTQLARVAALEWGSDRIRVNIIHPDAVFDTGIYTKDVLEARAAHYGITVEQYKKRNLLKAEITSHDVAELIAEMCGPLFRTITGAQIQMDGGNDRTI